jgi:hypothetical protein
MYFGYFAEHVRKKNASFYELEQNEMQDSILAIEFMSNHPVICATSLYVMCSFFLFFVSYV